MPDVVQSLWIGTELTSIQRLSIRSFLENGHEYHLYAYEDIGDVPDGTSICDASSVLPRENIFCYQTEYGKGSYSAFSNLFRYKLLFEKGGWWVDTDVVCLKPLDFEEKFVFATENEEDGTSLASSCIIKSPAGSEYLEYCMKVCSGKDMAKIVWGEIGPRLMEDAINRFSLGRYRVSPRVFNPVNWFGFKDIVEKDFDLSRLSESYAVHLWHQMWKANHLDPDDDWHPRSLYGILRKRYLDFPPSDADPVGSLRRRLTFQERCIEDLQRSLGAAEREGRERQLALESARQEISKLENALTEVRQEISLLNRSMEEAQRKILGLQNSMSWKITAPLRFVYDAFVHAASRMRKRK